ncbi:MAG: uroporphyrinogen decarboxylase [Halobacteriovoraceae bacterium]|jgi:uroporphyrinogen decarboxylase|nr:uroporphyrinogen decarboxylase [Halobacteriovoraceae bacterium]MBT5094953.1 uroporphyrinogen decarboxylase [Halobacteriovoraceae bacterium]
MGLFNNRVTSPNGKTQVPVWFMRQAGRYHAHYQNIKKDSDFMTMCKDPKLACEITMGPLDEFGFDAAILFSDLLFPLQQLGMDLVYAPGPKLGQTLDSKQLIQELKVTTESKQFYNFQKEACQLLRPRLDQKETAITLLGFTGAPFTLYTYATEGSHAGGLISSKQGLYDGRFLDFCEKLIPLTIEQLSLQAEGGADAVCLFDTAAGEMALNEYKKFAVPAIQKVVSGFKKLHPDKKVIYYAKMAHLEYYHALETRDIDVLGIDWRCNLGQALTELGPDYYVQGNFDPSLLHLPWQQLEERLKEFWAPISGHPNLSKWIMGLGHGVLQKTPEENVKKTIEYVHEHFTYA